jgi:diguanylate cyclase (GGDEF)-like protein/PAS domain S-box-containing protein
VRTGCGTDARPARTLTSPDRPADDGGVPRATFTAAQVDALLRNVADLVAVLDDDGTISVVSPAAATLLGYRPDQLLGKNASDLLHPEDIQMFLEGWELALTKSGPAASPPIRLRHADGSWIDTLADVLIGPELDGMGSMVVTARRSGAVPITEQALRERLVNEDRLVSLASTFVGLPMERFDEGVHDTLAVLGSMPSIARVSVFRVDESIDSVVLTHQWAAQGIELSESDLILPTAGSPSMARLSRLQEAHLDLDLEGDSEPYGEVAIMRRQGFRSVLAVPMAEDGRFAGFLSFSSVLGGVLPDSTYSSMLRAAAGILGEAFARHKAEQRLAYQATVDGLTGLANRWSYMDALGEAVDGLRRDDIPAFAVLLIDLDRFKVVNDSLGHQAGDRLLITVAERFRSAACPDELVARFGGDEIIVLLPGCPDEGSAVARATALLRCLEEPVQLGAHEFTVTASGGLAIAEPDLDPEELLRRADAAMFRAKERGRRRIEVFDDALRARVTERLHQESDLQRAVREGELCLHFQPEVDVATGLIRGVEALLRWEHPTRGLVVAGDFIDIAEETGAILEIGDWAIAEACRHLARWQQAGLDLTVRANLSARQINQPDLVDRLIEIIGETDVDPSGLCLEITETAVMADAELSLLVLSKLAGLGLRLAIDDFGTGYSSLDYLKRFPVHILKIDRAFVSGLATSSDDAAIVRAILSLADSLGLAATAEGVETEEQRAGLLALGCERAQGWYFAPAVPPDELERLVKTAIPLPHRS